MKSNGLSKQYRADITTPVFIREAVMESIHGNQEPQRQGQRTEKSLTVLAPLADIITRLLLNCLESLIARNNVRQHRAADKKQQTDLGKIVSHTPCNTVKTK